MRTQADPGSLQPQSQRQDVGHHHRRRASDGDGNPSQAQAIARGFPQEPQPDLDRASRVALGPVEMAVNQDIKSSVTYSVVTKRLHDDVIREFIHRELERLGLAHSTFTSGATELILRTSDGVLRRCRNLCLSAMLEAVRASTGRTIDIDIVNRVLLQPHWQTQVDLTDF